jgi:hypothetical protein
MHCHRPLRFNEQEAPTPLLLPMMLLLLLLAEHVLAVFELRYYLSGLHAVSRNELLSGAIVAPSY